MSVWRSESLLVQYLDDPPTHPAIPRAHPSRYVPSRPDNHQRDRRLFMASAEQFRALPRRELVREEEIRATLPEPTSTDQRFGERQT